MLLPYASERPPRDPPATAASLVLLHFLLFGLVALMLAVRGPQTGVDWFAALGLAPDSPRWYTLLTYSFLHEDVLHLSGNMLFLWVFGASVEDAIGWRRFLALYLVAVVFSGVVQVVMARALGPASSGSLIIGASGAISALVGVFAVRFYRSRVRFIGLPVRVPALLLVALALAAEIAAAAWQLAHRDLAGKAAAHWAHIAGFALGVLWAQASRLMQAGRHEYLAVDAAVEMQRGSPLAAAHRLEALLAAQPGNLRAEAELGRAWAQVGEKAESIAHYRTAIGGYLRQGDRAEAAARFLEMTERFPEETLPAADQFAVAAALEDAGRYSEALAAFEGLLKQSPDSREAELALVRCGTLMARRLGRQIEGAARLEEFLQKYPRSEWTIYVQDTLRAARAAKTEALKPSDAPEP